MDIMPKKRFFRTAWVALSIVLIGCLCAFLIVTGQAASPTVPAVLPQVAQVSPVPQKSKVEQSQISQPVQSSYDGRRLSLNFQDIRVRSVLQLLAEFTGLNIVISDTVQGNITLRLKNVPWEQVLEIILKTRGLSKRRMGDVLLIAPVDELAAQEKKEELIKDIVPLHAALIQVNYANAPNLLAMLRDTNNSLLSPRGRVSVDQRTNTLWIQDTPEKIIEIRKMIRKLDVPVRQVLIESRIVLVSDTFSREFGVRLGLTRPHVSGTLDGANTILTPGNNVNSATVQQRLNVNLPATNVGQPGGAGSIGIALARLSKNTFLDLELSAAESEGLSKTMSTPRLITADKQPARIESGEEIPYQEAASSGATSVAFKKAVLSLDVTPHVTPDNKILLDLTVTQDSRGTTAIPGGPPAINTQRITTHVLADNGETLVLGGIYTRNQNNVVTRIPFLGDIPVLGALFRKTVKADNKVELIIFVTPKIIEDEMLARN